MPAELFAAILHWRNPASLKHCVRSLRAQCSAAHIVVIDNSAHEFPLAGSARDIGAQHIIEMPFNTGYAGGMSCALEYWLAQTQHRFGLLLTQDVVLAEDALSLLMVELETYREAGIVGPLVRDARTSAVFSAGGVQDRSSARVRSLRRCRRQLPYRTDWLDGCALLMRRTVAEQLRTFDTRFFMYYEEIDFCERARRAGWAIVLNPNAVVFQEKDVLPGSHYFYYTARNRYLFWQKHYGTRWPQVLLSHLVDTAGLCAWVLRGQVRPGTVPRKTRWRWLARQLAGTLRGTIDFLHKRFGPMPDRAMRAPRLLPAWIKAAH